MSPHAENKGIFKTHKSASAGHIRDLLRRSNATQKKSAHVCCESGKAWREEPFCEPSWEARAWQRSGAKRVSDWLLGPANEDSMAERKTSDRGKNWLRLQEGISKRRVSTCRALEGHARLSTKDGAAEAAWRQRPPRQHARAAPSAQGPRGAASTFQHGYRFSCNSAARQLIFTAVWECVCVCGWACTDLKFI